MLFFYANSFLTLLIGNMFVYAMIIFSRASSGSDAITGFVYAGNLVPPLILGLYAGTLLDRFHRKTVVMIAQTSFILTGSIMMWLTASHPGVLTPAVLIGVMVINGIGLSFIIPGRLALLGDLVEAQRIPKESMKIQIMIMLGFGLAPFVVGFLRRHYEWPVVFGTIAVIYALATLLLIPVKTTEGRRDAAESPWASLKHGLGYVRSQPMILSLLAATYVGLFLVGPLQVLMPEFARSRLHLNDAERGSLMTLLGVGLLLGGALAQFLAHCLRRGLMIVSGAGASGLAMFFIADSQSPVFVAVALCLAGIFGGLMSTLIPAALQQHTADASRGRVMSIYNIIFQSAVGSAAIGLSQLSRATNISLAIQTGGLMIVGGAALCWLLKPLRTLR
jgi:MFS family permease